MSDTGRLRGVRLSYEQLAGLRAALLESITSERLEPDRRHLATALRSGIAEACAMLEPAAADTIIGLVLPTECFVVALAAVEHVLATVRPFEMRIRVHLDPSGVESIKRALEAVVGA